MKRLHHRVVLVTGASRGIGRAIALACAREGARLALMASHRPALAKVGREVRRLDGRGMTLVGDVRREAQVERVVQKTVQAYGRLDILVTCAGVGTFLPVADTSLAVWEAMIETNLTGTFLCVKHALNVMRPQRRGDLVLVASIAGLEPFAGSSAYCASKFGVVGFARSVSQEVRSGGIRVTTVCPGAVDTPLWDQIPKGPDRKQMLTPEEVAEAVINVLTVSDRAVVDQIVLTPPLGVL